MIEWVNEGMIQCENERMIEWMICLICESYNFRFPCTS